jgi:hypothetical protein
MEVFFPSTNGELHHIFQTARNNGWSQVGNFAGILRSRPVAIANSDKRLEIFHVGQDGGRLYNAFQTAPNDGWQGWQPRELNNLVGHPGVGRNADGRLEVFAINDARDVVHQWQDRAAGGPWHHGSLGGSTLGGLGVGVAELGRCTLWESAGYL